jgi:hypothetical protein
MEVLLDHLKSNGDYPRATRPDGGNFHSSLSRLTLVPKPVDLFDVVPSVDPMKFPPLAGSQGAENGMIEHASALAIKGFAPSNGLVHVRYPLADFAYQFFWHHSTRESMLWRFSSFGHVSEAGDHEGS